MKKFLRWLFYIVVILVVLYLVGPSPSTPEYKTDMPAVPSTATALESYIKDNEAQHKLKPDNEARIVWANDSLKNKTEYVIVYLHGFSASQEEGNPIHRNIAKEFGCNLYLSRLAEHGIDTIEPMSNLTADKYWNSAKQALAIGKQLGNKVILMGTSTGGTNALQLAATYPDDVAALVLLSPNIAIFNKNAWVLNNHWGFQLAKKINKGDHVISDDARPIYKQYWYANYPLKAVVQLQEMLETTMVPATFEKVHQPTLMLYYYKDAVHQDSVVQVEPMLKMFDQLGTPAVMKRKIDMQNTGNHVMGSYIKSHDVESVQAAIETFMTEVLKVPKKGS